MSNILSDRLGRLSTSATLAMSQKSSELKAQGIDIINMSVGEPDFNTPDHIKAASNCSGVILKSCSMVEGINTGVASARSTMSG